MFFPPAKDGLASALNSDMSENRKNSGNQGCSKSKGRGTSTSGRVAKDECAYCREKGHWKKDCPKKRGNDSSKANIVHSDEDDDSNLALLETSVVPQDPIQSVEEDSEVESNDSDTVEGEVPVDSSSQQQQQKDSIATSRPRRVIRVPASQSTICLGILVFWLLHVWFSGS
ncbi:hypothetical protein RHSIM_Rhsim11G0147500 [Rhododendron simsii]|uniref:CCHC-type domain-containing protein n=1 Tax=Rhododendron simsii TaxID=118357 RepID=A0A834GCF9_RHOSS|nr:hypothetical protein RHSIM_Rhsim11G0147500 [Rhododendron simsii]